jgi:sigma-E factor negative regulatory protein RseB
MPFILICFSLFLYSASTLSEIVDDELLKENPVETSVQEIPEDIVIESLEDLFSAFSTANKRYSYRSLLTYEANGFITTFKLNHQIDSNRANQQLVFLDGPRRQVLRQQNLSSCQSGNSRWGVWPTAVPNASIQGYRFRVIGTERIANRLAVIVDIIPQDEFRYGYRYSIDQETGLVLKLITLEKGKIIERLQTVSIDILPSYEELELEKDSGYLWRVPETEPCHTEQFQSGWQVSWLPESFQPVGNRITTRGEQVLIFSDGLVSVSVFIINKGAEAINKATARHGATVVVISPTSSDPERRIAVVGEVPTVTARRIAVSVKPID